MALTCLLYHFAIVTQRPFSSSLLSPPDATAGSSTLYSCQQLFSSRNRLFTETSLTSPNQLCINGTQVFIIY